MPSYHVRAAVKKDLPVILNHRRLMFEDMGYNDPRITKLMLESSKPLFERGLEDGSYRAWLVEESDGKIVAGGGVITLEFHSHPRDPRSERAWIVNMYTEPEHRRRGLARLLMKTMLEWCRSAGMRRVFLHASDYGRPLYESMGFEPSNEMVLFL